MRLLAIETSCDETAVAIVSESEGVVASYVSSQIDLHKPFGGVVPEVACRAHQEWLPSMTRKIMEETGLSSSHLDGIAVTYGPGLVGSLLVGISFARGLAWAWGLPWIGVNHLEGHLASLQLCEEPFHPPFIALLASGGHTDFYLVDEKWSIQCLGGTLDDAAGEAFDKVSHLLGLGYPGGPAIEKSALLHDGKPIHRFSEPMKGKPGCDLSFSGLKTAVALALDEEQQRGQPSGPAYWSASFQDCVVKTLTNKLSAAVKMSGMKNIALVGGVAANQKLRGSILELAKKKNWNCGISPLKYCGDNAAMIGMAAFHIQRRDGWSPLELDAAPRLSLG